MPNRVMEKGDSMLPSRDELAVIAMKELIHVVGSVTPVREIAARAYALADEMEQARKTKV